jgi:hypothetical protein
MDLKYLEPTYQYIKDFKEKHEEYSEENVEKFFVYMAYEGSMLTANYFLKIKNQIIRNSMYFIDEDNRDIFIRNLIREFLKDIKSKSETENFKMPTEIKIIYDCVSDTFDTKVSYEKKWSVRKKIGPYEVFQKWFEDTKKEYEQ